MGKRLTQEDFIRRAIEKHGDKYDYSQVVYKNSNTKIKIICHEKDENGNEHGVFNQTPSRHLCGDRCPACFRSFKKTTEQFIEDARKVHGDKYDYSKVDYQGNKKYVIITCPKHGDFSQKPLFHLQGQGCQKCYDERRGNTIRVTLDEFLSRSKEKHGDKYDYSKVDYERGNIEVCIICPKHGEFWQRPDKHMKGHGCPKCGNELNGFNKRLTTEEFIERAKQVHGNKYDYSKVKYRTTNDYVTIICPKHGDFEQKANVHICGRGCQACNESGLEREVGLLLERRGILFIKQKGFDWLGRKLLDFYIPRYHLAIECQGLQHFNSVEHFGGDEEFEKRINLDIAKYTECTENGVKTIYVVRDKNGINYDDPRYNGIYENSIFEINEMENKLEELC